MEDGGISLGTFTWSPDGKRHYVITGDFSSRFEEDEVFWAKINAIITGTCYELTGNKNVLFSSYK